MAWSYELLDDAERRLLARLSVLRGAFDLGTAERVAAGGPLRPEAIAGLLASLAGKSLVHIRDGAAVRYSLLETIRQFAAGRLAASGEETTVHSRLLDWALGEARSADATVGSTGWAAWAQPAVGRTRQHSRCPVVGARRAGTRGGTGAGRPARPVVDRHRPVQRSGPVPDRGGRHPGRGGSRSPGPGAARRGLVGVPLR